MNKTFTMTRYSFLTLWRQRAWLVSLFYWISLVLLAGGFATIIRGYYYATLIQLSNGLMSVLCALLVIYYGSTSLAQEAKQYTLMNLLTKPVSRQQIIWSKYACIVSFVLLMLLVMTLMCMSLLATPLHLTPVATLTTLFQQWCVHALQMIQLAAVCLIFNALTEYSLVAIVFSVMTYGIGMYADLLQRVPTFIEQPVIGHAMKYLFYLFPNFSFYHLTANINVVNPANWHTLGDLALYSLTYSVFAVVVATLIFQARRLS